MPTKIITAFIFFLFALSASAQQPADKDALQRQREQLKKEIEETEKALIETRKTTKVNLGQLSLINKKMDLQANIHLLGGLPKLTVLHLEGDGIAKLPDNFGELKHLEKLYLNNNKFNQVPPEIKMLKTLKYVDMQNNPMPMYKASDYKTFGFKVKF